MTVNSGAVSGRAQPFVGGLRRRSRRRRSQEAFDVVPLPSRPNTQQQV